MSPLLAKLAESLRARDESLASLAGRVARSVRALASAKVWLRGADTVGRRARCFGARPHVENRGRISIGDDFGASCTFGALSLVTTPSGTIEIGDGVTLNYGTSIRATGAVRFGDRVLVGPYCVIEDSDGPGDPRPVEIGDDVWLAARVVVRPGARIGSGAVIAAGSVVEGEIPPNAVASGAPARVLRVRDGRSEDSALRRAVKRPPEMRRAPAG